MDVFLSPTRDQVATKAFVRQAIKVTGIIPETITSDKHSGYPPALEEVFGEDVEHRTSKYKNNHLEQDHRGVKGRTPPDAQLQVLRQCCSALPGLRRDAQLPAPVDPEQASAALRQAIHVQRVAALRDMLAVA
ncbi:transposase [Azospirillum brasilense]|uniref:transposase n=1 Tax=Azospirillum brasilense TaxID=192 RepID=UPI001FFF3067|nr:transposase [Azospirillum brasilense]